MGVTAIVRDTVRARIVRSDKDSHFSGALAQNAAELESLDLPGQWGSRCSEFVVENIVIIADQALEWDLFLWGSDGADDADLDLDTFVDYVNFPAASGKQVAGAGSYYYASPSDLGIPVTVTNNKLNLSLVNRSVTAKNAGATGEVVVICTLRPVFGA